MFNKEFKLISKNRPAGDQPRAIKQLVDGLKKGYAHQTLLGVTGSGKTYTVANVIAQVQKPALVIAHNKTLAAQLCNEFRELFPQNAVHYFVSYYDYYQPEAYLPQTDTYIDKEALINDEIDKLRHAATTSLLTRQDVVVVASVSCIYNLGTPENYRENILRLKTGEKILRNDLVSGLIARFFTRTNSDLKRGTFRLRGDSLEIFPPQEEIIYSLEIKNGKIDKIFAVDPTKGWRLDETSIADEVIISPAKHFLAAESARKLAIQNIKTELKERLKLFEEQKKFLEAERLERRTKFDLAMIDEIGYCHGVENYSRHFDGRAPGEPPATLLDYFPHKRGSTQPATRINADSISIDQRDNRRKSASLAEPDFLTIIDESHITVPQIAGMYEGDASRKKTLIEYGFRLPSAADNRPLKFHEFEKRVGQVIYTSATPRPYELKKSRQTCPEDIRLSSVEARNRGVVEQIIRPTGLVDPKITIKPARGQVQDLIPRIKERVETRERVLITTLTKRMAEDLAAYLEEQKMKVTYLHSDVKTLERIRILTNLRRGNFDVLVGVNLLREGLDLPEVSLVAIMDADKEGFLRSETSLIQTIGRASRNINGEVLIYADQITGSIRKAVQETERRRNLQIAYNKKHNITPRTIIKAISDILPSEEILSLEMKPVPKSKTALESLIKEKEKEMREAAKNLNFELAAILRDEIKTLTQNLRGAGAS